MQSAVPLNHVSKRKSWITKMSFSLTKCWVFLAWSLTLINRVASGQSMNFSLNSIVSMFWLTFPNTVHFGLLSPLTGTPPFSSAVIQSKKPVILLRNISTRKRWAASLMKQFDKHYLQHITWMTKKKIQLTLQSMCRKVSSMAVLIKKIPFPSERVLTQKRAERVDREIWVVVILVPQFTGQSNS